MSSPKGTWRRGDLAYCSNVHPADGAEAVEAVVSRYVGEVRKLRGLANMGSGLWLSRTAASQLLEPSRLAAFNSRLAENGIELFTLNGFPYGNFHADSVKEKVYLPDWSEPERLSYTVDLAEILAACLAEGRLEGTISTLPLGYRPAWTDEKNRSAAENLCRLAGHLDGLYRRTGKSIRICLEMEPDCVLETTQEAIAFFQRDLQPRASKLSVPEPALQRHLGICFDICHQAVMFEDIKQSLADFLLAGIKVGKIQVSSALEIPCPYEEEARRELGGFDEPRYLHQVRTLADGKLLGRGDLGPALDEDGLPSDYAWRVHFHVPIQAERLQHKALATTREAIIQVLDFLIEEPGFRPQLEVETYTWHVLPDALRPRTDLELVRGIALELEWLETQLNQRGLLAPL